MVGAENNCKLKLFAKIHLFSTSLLSMESAGGLLSAAGTVGLCKNRGREYLGHITDCQLLGEDSTLWN
jgi:hypothetical protein